MESHGEQTHFVKRVVLPSGKTIEVVYFREAEAHLAEPEIRLPEPEVHLPEPEVHPEPYPAAEPDQELHVCIECASELVYPVRWEEAGPENWTVLLHCPNCDVHREGVFAQETVEAFDEQLDRGGDALARDYKRLMRANMAEEIERFVGALRADAILAEDF
jgi:hypothetical protein